MITRRAAVALTKAEVPMVVTVWTFTERSLLHVLRRCHTGESPDAVLAELWANTEPEVGEL